MHSWCSAQGVRRAHPVDQARACDPRWIPVEEMWKGTVTTHRQPMASTSGDLESTLRASVHVWVRAGTCTHVPTPPLACRPVVAFWWRLLRHIRSPPGPAFFVTVAVARAHVALSLPHLRGITVIFYPIWGHFLSNTVSRSITIVSHYSTMYQRVIWREPVFLEK